MIIVDASVAVKWYVPEPGEEAAKNLLADPRHELLAPALIRIEVIAAILKAYREARVPEMRAKAAIAEWQQTLDDGIVHLVPDEEVLGVAVDISFQSQHPLQDCLYLAVARTMKAELITADDKMFKRGGKAIAGVKFLEGMRYEG